MLSDGVRYWPTLFAESRNAQPVRGRDVKADEVVAAMNREYDSGESGSCGRDRLAGGRG